MRITAWDDLNEEWRPTSRRGSVVEEVVTFRDAVNFDGDLLSSVSAAHIGTPPICKLQKFTNAGGVVLFAATGIWYAVLNQFSL